MRLLWLVLLVQFPSLAMAAGAMLMVITARSEVPYVASTIHSYQQRYNEKFNHDWVIVTYPGVLKEFRETIRNIAHGSTVRFVDLKYMGPFLTFPKGTDTIRVRNERANTPLKSPWRRLYNTVYARHFTRFTSGHLYNLDNIWLLYQYYWRVPVGSSLGCDVDYDVFKYMEEKDIKYGFLLIREDSTDWHPSLINLIQQYAEDSANEIEPAPSKNNFQFLIDTNQMLESNQWAHRSCNFDAGSELVNVEFFQSPQYKHFFNYLDLFKGIYYETWRDAAIKTAAVSLFLPSHQVKHMNLPVMSPMFGLFNCPDSQDAYLKNRCVCDANNHGKEYKFGSMRMSAEQIKQGDCLLYWNSLQVRT